MSSATQRFLLPLQIAAGCLVGGIASLISLRVRTNYWSDGSFWVISVSSHSVLIAIALWIYREKPLDLNTWSGIFNTCTLAFICSVTVLLLFVLGAYVPLGLIFTGRALLTSFVAAIAYALLRTFD